MVAMRACVCVCMYERQVNRSAWVLCPLALLKGFSSLRPTPVSSSLSFVGAHGDGIQAWSSWRSLQPVEDQTPPPSFTTATSSINYVDLQGSKVLIESIKVLDDSGVQVVLARARGVCACAFFVCLSLSLTQQETKLRTLSLSLSRPPAHPSLALNV